MKEKIYNTIAHLGIWFLSAFFPEYFAQEPLKPTDRYIEYPFVLENLPKLPATILDVGCSGSMFPLILKALGYEVSGIDIRGYYPENKIFFTKSDICISAFKSNFFDVITAVSTIEHIGLKGRYSAQEDYEGDIKAVKEIHRILKPNGIFLMTVPYAKYPLINKNHRIYNAMKLNLLMSKWAYEVKILPSPEADYELALIKTVKNG